MCAYLVWPFELYCLHDCLSLLFVLELTLSVTPFTTGDDEQVLCEADLFNISSNPVKHEVSDGEVFIPSNQPNVCPRVLDTGVTICS